MRTVSVICLLGMLFSLSGCGWLSSLWNNRETEEKANQVTESTRRAWNVACKGDSICIALCTDPDKSKEQACYARVDELEKNGGSSSTSQVATAGTVTQTSTNTDRSATDASNAPITVAQSEDKDDKDKAATDSSKEAGEVTSAASRMPVSE